jgi:tetrahydromethanopterin S-methyltransferase subunit B
MEEEDMEKDFNLRNVVWISMILISAGSVYGMLSQKVRALEEQQRTIEQVVLEDIPEIKERVIKLEVMLDILIKANDKRND